MTKIVATVGPASDSEDTLRRMMRAGVNVLRFNMKHNVPKWHLDRINLAQKIADGLKLNIGIMIDLQGPEIRIETYQEKDIELIKGDSVFFVGDFNETSELPQIRIAHDIVLEALEVSDVFSIEDGFYEFEVIEKVSTSKIKAKILQNGVVKHKKSLNLIGKDVDLPSLIEEDLDKLNMATKAKVDFVALSYARTTQDIETLREELKRRKLKAKIVAKIESQKGLDNIGNLIDAADAIMIARGDLGIETSLEELVYHQKRIIRKCRSASVPVIVATQMLQSMVTRPIPTRAEAADVANAVYDETDAVMLSAETATGAHPVKAVETMQKILKFNEEKKPRHRDFVPESVDQTHAIVNAAMDILNSKSVDIDMVLVSSETGYTGRVFSSHRPRVPITVLSEDKHTVEALTLNYGVLAYYTKFSFGDSRDTEKIISDLVREGFLKTGNTVLVVHGRRWKDPGNTNSLFIIQV